MFSKEKIESVINKEISKLEDKVAVLENKLNRVTKANRLIDKNMDAILANTIVQVNKVLQTYDELSRNKLSFEEKYQFAQYLINLYNKANRIVEVKRISGIDDSRIDDSIELMKSSDLHDKVIGIDNFISLAHTTGTLLIDLLAINNNFYLTNYDDITEEEQSAADKFVLWRKKLNVSVIDKLNKIRNRKGLLEIEDPELYLVGVQKGEFYNIKNEMLPIITKEFNIPFIVIRDTPEHDFVYATEPKIYNM